MSADVDGARGRGFQPCDSECSDQRHDVLVAEALPGNRSRATIDVISARPDMSVDLSPTHNALTSARAIRSGHGIEVGRSPQRALIGMALGRL